MFRLFIDDRPKGSAQTRSTTGTQATGGWFSFLTDLWRSSSSTTYRRRAATPPLEVVACEHVEGAVMTPDGTVVEVVEGDACEAAPLDAPAPTSGT